MVISQSKPTTTSKKMEKLTRHRRRTNCKQDKTSKERVRHGQVSSTNPTTGELVKEVGDPEPGSEGGKREGEGGRRREQSKSEVESERESENEHENENENENWKETENKNNAETNGKGKSKENRNRKNMR